MKITVTKERFLNEFFNSSRKEHFSYDALVLIYEWIEETSEDEELDIIGICCGYQELTINDIIMQYSVDVEDREDEQEVKDRVESYLQDKTCLLGFVEDTNSFVFTEF